MNLSGSSKKGIIVECCNISAGNKLQSPLVSSCFQKLIQVIMTIHNNILQKRRVGLFSRVGLFLGDYGNNKASNFVERMVLGLVLSSSFCCLT